MCVHYRQSVSPSDAAEFFSQGSLKLAETAARSNIEPGHVREDKDGPIMIADSVFGELVFETMRWGFPHYKNPKDQIVNIRNLKSSWWRGINGDYLLKPEYRCLIPFTAFAEYSQLERKEVFFSIGAPFPVFAGIWRPWTGARLKPVVGRARRQRLDDNWKLYAFLTTEANGVVEPHHDKAMPTILTTQAECEEWMGGGEDSLRLQRPLPDEMVKRVA